MRIMTVRAIRILALLVPLLALAAVAAWHYGWLGPGDRRAGSGIAAIGGPFTLIDHNGEERTDQDFRGRMMLIYFGFTYCPDVCPTALQIMSVAMDHLGKDAEAVQPILITIDPARDTPPVLKEYLANFGDRFVGLTGSEEQIGAAARAYRVYYAKAGQPAADEKDYMMDHSSIVFLMGRDGRYISHFTHNSYSEEIAETVRKHL
jgi:cytochrome oxidase Cu insertion factor (SCO1/SenC/PrrC family)